MTNDDRSYAGIQLNGQDNQIDNQITAEITAEKYRPNVGAVILNREGMVFVGKRLGTNTQAWQMPQGGIIHGESEEDALLRELSEEVGSTKFELMTRSKDFYYYKIPERMRKVFWQGEFVGQRQRWFLVRFVGQDEDLNVHTEIPEFSGWKWSSVDEVIGSVVSFKRKLYHQVFKEFQLL